MTILLERSYLPMVDVHKISETSGSVDRNNMVSYGVTLCEFFNYRGTFTQNAADGCLQMATCGPDTQHSCSGTHARSVIAG